MTKNILASNVPVICTAVSELPQYLNSSNAFITTPGNIDAIAELPIENLYLGLGTSENLNAVTKLDKLKHIVGTYDCVYHNKTLSDIWDGLEKKGVSTRFIECKDTDVNTNAGTFLNAYYPYNLMKKVFGRELF